MMEAFLSNNGNNVNDLITSRFTGLAKKLPAGRLFVSCLDLEMNRIIILALLAVLLVGPSVVMGAEATPGDFVFELDKVFLPQTSVAKLVERFGEANVTTEQIYIGEGFYEEGTVLFKNSDEKKVEILWKDPELLKSEKGSSLLIALSI